MVWDLFLFPSEQGRSKGPKNDQDEYDNENHLRLGATPLFGLLRGCPGGGRGDRVRISATLGFGLRFGLWLGLWLGLWFGLLGRSEGFFQRIKIVDWQLE